MSTEQSIPATSEQCERIHACLVREGFTGATVTNLSYWTSIDRRIVIEALEQMRERGAVVNCGTQKAYWVSTTRKS